MSNLKSQLHEKDRHIRTARFFGILFFITVLVLSFVIYTFPNRLNIYTPPDVRAASQRPWWEVPRSTVYAFAYQVFQQLNRWNINGEEDYKENIARLKPLLTPSCQSFLQQDYQDRLQHGELRDRARGVYEIVGRGFSEDKITVFSQDSWGVNLDLSVDEYFQDEPVKRVFTRFPISIVRMDVDTEKNPWGLGFNCYTSIPQRLEGVEQSEGNK